jgi:hypothetical protein
VRTPGGWGPPRPRARCNVPSTNRCSCDRSRVHAQGAAPAGACRAAKRSSTGSQPPAGEARPGEAAGAVAGGHAPQHLHCTSAPVPLCTLRSVHPLGLASWRIAPAISLAKAAGFSFFLARSSARLTRHARPTAVAVAAPCFVHLVQPRSSQSRDQKLRL